MTAPNLQGLIPILATPFSDDGALDVDSLRRLVHFELECGVDGLGLFGFASEAFALTESERDHILRAVTEEVSGTVPLVVGAGGMGTLPAIEQSKRMIDLGADALMVLPPSMAKPDGPRLVEFYGEVAEAARVPVMIQDAPVVVGMSISLPVMQQLAELPGVDYAKIETQPTAVKVHNIVEAVNGNLRVFGGQNALFCLEEMDRGAVGTMPACEFSDGLRTVLDERAAGRREKARERYHRLLPLIRYGLQPGIAWGIHKEILRMAGIIESSRVRSPAVPLDEATRAGLLDTLVGLDLKALQRKK